MCGHLGAISYMRSRNLLGISTFHLDAAVLPEWNEMDLINLLPAEIREI